MSFEGLDALSREGHEILSAQDRPELAVNRLTTWIDDVSNYLNLSFPNTGLVAKWLSIGKAELSTDTGNYLYSLQWSTFKNHVERRISWFADLPNAVRMNNLLNSTLDLSPENRKTTPLSQSQPTKLPFINLEKIRELEQLNNDEFDLKKFVALCKELNICHREGCWYAVSALTRTILHYVPPIFGQPNFESTVAQFKGKSYKGLFKRLIEVAKSTADIQLHESAKKVEGVLTEQQVNFSSELNTLIQEVYLKLKRKGGK